jgi:hypothetical protein
MSSRFDRLADLARPAALDPEAFISPLLQRRDYHRPSLFRPENMLREARRQKGLESGHVPAICVLDPDGDIAAHARADLGATRSAHWACYHTEMWVWEHAGSRYGVIGRAVGSPFFASGCELIVSIASAGQIGDGEPPYHVIVERALRDEGTSYHYLPPARYVDADAALVKLAAETFTVRAGATWTTDAPFRETAETIADRREEGILAVEMEAAALYALAEAHERPILCLAHVSNQLGRIEGDFEKGDRNGACSSLDLVTIFAAAWRRTAGARRAKIPNGMPRSK